MVDLKNMFDDMHRKDPPLAHLFLRWLIDTYGRQSDQVKEVYGELPSKDPN